MSVGEKIVEKLEQLMGPDGLSAEPQRPLRCVEHGPISVEAHALEFDRLGCSFAELTVRSIEPVEKEPSVKARAERMADSVTYLMERLALVEIDEASQRAQLRSAPPWQAGGAVEYYEAFLSSEMDGTLQVHLARYRQDAGAQRRRSVPLNLTREVLQRLLDDLAEVVSPAMAEGPSSLGAFNHVSLISCQTRLAYL